MDHDATDIVLPVKLSVQLNQSSFGHMKERDLSEVRPNDHVKVEQQDLEDTGDAEDVGMEF